MSPAYFRLLRTAGELLLLPKRGGRCTSRCIVALVMAIFSGFSTAVAAEVWAYIDDSGQTHFAREKVDTRYQLFFKGETIDDRSATQFTPATPASPPSQFPLSAALQRLANHGQDTRYQHLIDQHARMQDIDPALVKAVIAAESAFQPNAVSPKGALGLMQLMPDTAARFGIKGDKKRSAEEKLLDPALNLRIGTQILRDLLLRFSNDLALTLAAYNAGEMAVMRYNNRIPPYPETIEYVKRVQRLYAVFRPPEIEASAAMSQKEETPSTWQRKRIRGTFLALPARDAEVPTL